MRKVDLRGCRVQEVRPVNLASGSKQLLIPFSSMFEVYDAIAVLGICNWNVGIYCGPYSRAGLSLPRSYTADIIVWKEAS